jgi:hypothetical protein
MDGTRFDTISRTLAGRVSRRRAVGGAAGGGLAAALVGVGGGRGVARAAQGTPESEEGTGTLSAGLCLMPFEAAIRQGPNAGETYLGLLALDVSSDGAIDQGVFVTTEGDDLAVVGQATGRAISLMITVEDGRFLYGVGTAEQPVVACDGQMGGPLVGPEGGDTGDWAVVDLGATALAGQRSNICRSCLQRCRSTCFFGCISGPPPAGACQEACLAFGGCTPDDF